MPSGFLSGNGPLELVLLIIKDCESLRDVLALTSTCRAMFHMGRNEAASRLWSKLLDDIPCFEEVLIAVNHNFLKLYKHGTD